MEDPILFWNHVCNEANRHDHTAPMTGRSQAGPTRSSRATAMVHLAMFDAYFGIVGLTPEVRKLYTALPACSPGASTKRISASVSAAAHQVLAALYPEQIPAFAEAAQQIACLNETDSVGHAYGLRIGQEILRLRRDDGSEREAMRPHPYAQAKPHHRADPLNTQFEPLGSTWGRVKPFAVSRFHHLCPYPPFREPAYKTDHEEALVKGGAASQRRTTRTVEETVIGLYWAYDGARLLGTPPRLYNQVVRVIAKKMCNSVADNARLFALVNVAMGDAGIHAWHWKYHYDLWRPVVGIREYDDNFGPDAKGGQRVDPLCDPFWRPLGAPKTNDVSPGARSFTPDFPAYPSGHATFGAAAFDMVRRFYREKDKSKYSFGDDEIDNIGFDFVSDELNGLSVDNDGAQRVRHERRYRSLADAIYENSVSRIYLGVHWRFDGTTGRSIEGMLKATDNIGGVPLGRSIAADIFARGIVPAAEGVVPPTTAEDCS
jgi:vanadium chloroperoxidase